MNGNSEQRVHAQLRTLAELAREQSGKGEVTLAIRHETLATIASSSRSTICWVLNQLQKQDAIRVAYREICLLANFSNEENQRPGTSPNILRVHPSSNALNLFAKSLARARL